LHPAWLGIVGMILGALVAVSSLEFVGRHEPSGWKLAATLTPIADIAWSLWLITIGIARLA
jgi:hypothetical protein